MEVINRVNIENLRKTELKLKRKNFILCALIGRDDMLCHNKIWTQCYDITFLAVKEYCFQMPIKINRVVSIVKQIVEELERC